MLITTLPHPRARYVSEPADYGRKVSISQALAHLAEKRPRAVMLRKRRAK